MKVLFYHFPHAVVEAEADVDAEPVDTPVTPLSDLVCVKNPLCEVMLVSVPFLPAGNDGRMPPVGLTPPSGPSADVDAATAVGVTVTVLWMMRVVVETMTEQASLWEPEPEPEP